MSMGLNKKEMASYGIGAVGKDMVYMFCASYILYYYQDILGLVRLPWELFLWLREYLMHLMIL